MPGGLMGLVTLGKPDIFEYVNGNQYTPEEWERLRMKWNLQWNLDKLAYDIERRKFKYKFFKRLLNNYIFNLF